MTDALPIQLTLHPTNESQFATSALRRVPVPILLSDDGLTPQPHAPLPWSKITQVSRWKEMTLVQFSPVDAIVIRDADLPPGLTPAGLAARIAAWQQ